ncbi:MAG: macrocin O-methyltransferase [Variovorax paradoxus]|uniref:Macrocin O-methyltransferase n=1 Tax=Variovorax paradoxus TaxID=34073 RepID=A0A2W5QF20_VARPD|nr:MAG: macrocin O-methyltransferase [Variovorax paradoxus]
MIESSARLADAASRGASSHDEASTRYLDLLERALTGQLWDDSPIDPWSAGYDPEVRAIGRDWPKSAITMIGTARLRNFRSLIEQSLAAGTPGDILEAGVWRGGACVLARAILAARGASDRLVWVADSFMGLPQPDDRYPADAGDRHSTFEELQVSLDAVKENFRKFDLLDDRVRFLPGWFEDTLPGAPIEALSVLRLDGDMYSSTIQTLDALYAKVSVGGYVIVDDYILQGCRRAVDDFRRDHRIEDALHEIDGAAVYWQKTAR